MNRDDMRRELADARRARTAKDADEFLEDFIDIVIREVAAGGRVEIHGLGTFSPADRAPRVGRNPRTGGAVPIPATRVPLFRPSAAFKRYVADPSTMPSSRSLGRRAPATKD